MEVRFRPKALQDLHEILEYIKAENPAAALRIIDDIEKFCMGTLSDNPRIGSKQDDIVSSLRIFNVSGYRICYFIRETHIDVVRILHHARDLSQHFNK